MYTCTKVTKTHIWGPIYYLWGLTYFIIKLQIKQITCSPMNRGRITKIRNQTRNRTIHRIWLSDSSSIYFCQSSLSTTIVFARKTERRSEILSLDKFVSFFGTGKRGKKFGVVLLSSVISLSNEDENWYQEQLHRTENCRWKLSNHFWNFHWESSSFLFRISLITTRILFQRFSRLITSDEKIEVTKSVVLHW